MSKQSKRRIFVAIEFERAFQDANVSTDARSRDVSGWLWLIDRCSSAAGSEWDEMESLERVLQIASFAVACLEQHGLVIPNDEAHVKFAFDAARQDVPLPPQISHDATEDMDGVKSRMIAEATRQHLATKLGLPVGVDIFAIFKRLDEIV